MVEPLWFVSGICVVRDGAWKTSLMAWDDMWHDEVTCDDFFFLLFTWSLRNLGELYRFVSIGARKNSRKGETQGKRVQKISRHLSIVVIKPSESIVASSFFSFSFFMVSIVASWTALRLEENNFDTMLKYVQRMK